MDRSYRYSRRIERRARLVRPLAAFGILVLAGAAMAFALSSPSDPIAAAVPAAAPSIAQLSAAAPAARPGTRRVYPYSVVPGGVASQAELVRIVRSDKVVAAHYATFDLGRAHAVTVARPRAVHVSYRKGDKVYWTAKKVMLREGETLLSDGKNEMRTRCANRVSDVAQFPVEAHAPSAEVLDAAFDEPDEGSVQNASAEMADDGGLPALGQQPLLAALASATAGETDSTSIGRSASAPLGGMPSIADRLGLRALTPLLPAIVPATMPGAAPQADDAATGGGAETAPALVVATEVIPSKDAAPAIPASPVPTGSSSPAPGAPPLAGNTGAVPPAAPGPGPTRPEPQPLPGALPQPAATPKPDTAAPVAPVVVEDTPKPTELPEPGTLSLIALALGTMLLFRNKN